MDARKWEIVAGRSSLRDSGYDRRGVLVIRTNLVVEATYLSSLVTARFMVLQRHRFVPWEISEMVVAFEGASAIHHDLAWMEHLILFLRETPQFLDHAWIRVVGDDDTCVWDGFGCVKSSLTMKQHHQEKGQAISLSVSKIEILVEWNYSTTSEV